MIQNKCYFHFIIIFLNRRFETEFLTTYYANILCFRVAKKKYACVYTHTTIYTSYVNAIFSSVIGVTILDVMPLGISMCLCQPPYCLLM